MEMTYLKDYQQPAYWVRDIHLTFELDDTNTQVKAVMNLERNEKVSGDLLLNGVDLNLKSILLDGKELPASSYQIDGEMLRIKELPSRCKLEINNEINPRDNKTLEGLYKSGNIFCTQNEAEGFRRITYYQDRPDVMAKFTTKIIADKKKYPVLLSNGNPIGSGELTSDKHWVEWEDPFKKPSYLYALVAGDLGMISDTFTTMSGRKVDLRIYCDKGNEGKCHHAMSSLKKAMKWDEEVFGLEYDLDIFMIVAVDAFNMGAMENKGLNIFNSSCVLVSPETATDENFLRVEGVVAHEYFHNWTGNRITCRDWFQLTLKEGLTVFRDQQFSADMNSAVVQRISDVEMLRSRQFEEDAGPNSHPIKPASYLKIDNFYTPTIYEKGAEVIRMIHTILGKDGFRRGMDKYFELFDGQAVTTEDFVHAMSVANQNYDFTQFKKWYHRSGTPCLKVTCSKQGEEIILEVEQSIPGQENCETLHIPLKVGFISENGKEVASKILHLTQKKQRFSFPGIKGRVVPSLNRNFSAPGRIDFPYSDEDLIFLASNDTDQFNRYEALIQLELRIISQLIGDTQKGQTLELPSSLVTAYAKLLDDEKIDNFFKALSMQLPTSSIVHQQQNPIDFEATFKVLKFVKTTLAQKLEDKFLAIYRNNAQQGEFKIDPLAMGKRAVKNAALSYLMELNHTDLALEQYHNADNMTDKHAALVLFANKDCKERDQVLADFYGKWKDTTLVIQKWLVAQASSPLDDTLDRVEKLQRDPVFDITVPNLVRSLIAAFARSKTFHRQDGKGYCFLADKIIEVDRFNPQLAARLAGLFNEFQRLQPQNKKVARQQLERVLRTEKLSGNTYEIVSKILA